MSSSSEIDSSLDEFDLDEFNFNDFLNTTTSPTTSHATTHHLHEIREARSLLMRRFKLPFEIAEMVLDFADYYLTMTTSVVWEGGTHVDGGVVSNSSAAMYLLSQPLPHVSAGEGRVHKVSFTMDSCDQGWSTQEEPGLGRS